MDQPRAVAIPDHRFIICADDTQDPEENEQQLARIKDWINRVHLDSVELTDVLSNFPDISVVRIPTFCTLLYKLAAELISVHLATLIKFQFHFSF